MATLPRFLRRSDDWESRRARMSWTPSHELGMKDLPYADVPREEMRAALARSRARRAKRAG